MATNTCSQPESTSTWLEMRSPHETWVSARRRAASALTSQITRSLHPPESSLFGGRNQGDPLGSSANYGHDLWLYGSVPSLLGDGAILDPELDRVPVLVEESPTA